MERDHQLSKQGHVLIAHTNLVSNLKYKVCTFSSPCLELFD